MEQENLPIVKAPSRLLAKGQAFFKKSRIGAPLLPEEHEELIKEERPQAPPAIPLLSHRPLSDACRQLAPLIPEGYVLRGLGSEPGDREALLTHWLSLGIEGLRTRFFFLPTEAVLARRASTMDFDNPRFAGIFAPDGTLACLAEWAHESESENEAEAAFSTAPGYRRKGFARIAAAACALDARSEGVEILRIDTLSENFAAKALAQSLGGAKKLGVPDGYADAVSSVINLKAIGPNSIEARMGLGEHAPEPARLKSGASPRPF